MEVNIIAAKFKPSGKVHYFKTKDLELEVSEGFIVQTERGLEYAEVVLEESQNLENQDFKDLPLVLRKATDKDLKILAQNQEKEKEYTKEAEVLIKKHKLDMKLIDTELIFDGSKILFTFTSEDRVDFRDLVKDLATKMKSRIELKQVGARDESKIVGGLGPCGRPVCCANYMQDFNKVSIKMAKNQGLALNPSKINGLCNRLMCCLAYEDDYYGEILKIMPKVGKKVSTPKGEGVNIYNNLLKKIVNVKFLSEDGVVSVEQFDLKDIVQIEKEDPSLVKCDTCPKSKSKNSTADQVLELDILEKNEENNEE